MVERAPTVTGLLAAGQSPVAVGEAILAYRQTPVFLLLVFDEPQGVIERGLQAAARQEGRDIRIGPGENVFWARDEVGHARTRFRNFDYNTAGNSR